MQHSVEFTEYKQVKIRYIRAGVGRDLILAFHGFSRSPEEFLPLMRGREKECTLLSFYIPGHTSAEPIMQPFIETTMWCEMMENLIAEHQPRHVIVLGYSLGGRIALHTCMHWSLAQYKLVLLAPDGIKVHSLQRFAMKHSWGMHIFDRVMKHPKTFMSICRVVAALKILDRSQQQFLLRQFNDEGKRQTIKKVFPLFRFFLADAHIVNEFITLHSDRIRIFLGERDLVIPPNTADSLDIEIRAKVVKILPEAGHDLLSESNMLVWSTELSQLDCV
jgi:pimeloyl-ACP methyl ester carboxylesterase